MHSSAFRLLEPLLRWRYAIITVVAYVFCISQLDAVGDWQFFVRGSQLLFGEHHVHSLLPGGLHVFANYPEIQIGPLSLLLAAPFRLFGDDSRGAVAVVLTAAAPALIYLLERTARVAFPTADRVMQARRSTAVLMGGILLAPAWSLLGTAFAHLDDVTVLACAAIAMWAIVRHRPHVVGVAIGLGIAAKPWAVILLPLVMTFTRRDRWKALAAAMSIAAGFWLPFVLADHYTLSAIRANTDVSPASVIHLFGASLDRIPGWIRPAQLAAALLVGVAAVMRGRWAAVLAVGIAARLILDPGTWAYYSSGLMFAALAWGLLRSARSSATWTAATFVLLDLTTGFNATIQAVARLGVTGALIASVVVPLDDLSVFSSREVIS